MEQNYHTHVPDLNTVIVCYSDGNWIWNLSAVSKTFFDKFCTLSKLVLEPRNDMVLAPVGREP